jgi:hypothetical protein
MHSSDFSLSLTRLNTRYCLAQQILSLWLPVHGHLYGLRVASQIVSPDHRRFCLRLEFLHFASSMF